MCHITTIVSGAVSFGVFAGVLSGIFYVALTALKWLSKLRLSLEEEAIKTRRGDSLTTDGLCTNCSNHNGSPGFEHSHGRSSNAQIPTPTSNRIRDRSSRRISCTLYDDNDGSVPSQIEESNDGSTTVQIREQIEKLVEKIVGGSLDGVSVGKLSRNACYGNGCGEDSPQAALAALKSSINKVISEAVKLPCINEVLQVPDTGEEVGNDSDFSSKSYEDILATAILNKVIEQSQKRRNRRHGKKSRGSRVKNEKTDNNNFEEETELMYNSDWSDTSRSEQLSLTIEEHIEEITTTYENSDDEEEANEEINLNSAIPFPESGRTIWNGENSDGEGQEHCSATEIVTSGNSWEENWLFQRKRLRSRPNAHHPVPVPMLVPNPSQDYRALIGGVDADDLSDMSECSDSALEDVVLASNEMDQDTQAGAQTELVNGCLKLEEAEDLGSPPSLNSESSCPSLSQRERDVSIDYEYFQKMDIELNDGSPTVPKGLDLTDSVAEAIPIKCQIAEREKNKWNNAVPLPDNPYSPENIRKREERKKMEYFRTGCHRETSVEFPCDSLRGITKEPSSETYSRDYYVRASRRPTGEPNIRTSPGFPTESFVEVSDYLDQGRNYHRRRSHCFDLFRGDLTKEQSFPPSNPSPATYPRISYGAHSLRVPSARKKKEFARSELSELEHKTLHEDMYHVVFRAKNASPNFVINPLFDDEEAGQRCRNEGVPSSGQNSYQKNVSRGQESGYGSDSHECSSDSSEFWRLTPPETPEMLESSLVTAFELRKARDNRGFRFFDTFPKSKRMH